MPINVDVITIAKFNFRANIANYLSKNIAVYHKFAENH